MQFHLTKLNFFIAIFNTRNFYIFTYTGMIKRFWIFIYLITLSNITFKRTIVKSIFKLSIKILISKTLPPSTWLRTSLTILNNLFSTNKTKRFPTIYTVNWILYYQIANNACCIINNIFIMNWMHFTKLRRVKILLILKNHFVLLSVSIELLL